MLHRASVSSLFVQSAPPSPPQEALQPCPCPHATLCPRSRMPRAQLLPSRPLHAAGSAGWLTIPPVSPPTVTCQHTIRSASTRWAQGRHTPHSDQVTIKVTISYRDYRDFYLLRIICKIHTWGLCILAKDLQHGEYPHVQTNHFNLEAVYQTAGV